MRSVLASAVVVIIASATAGAVAYAIRDLPATAGDLDRLYGPTRVAAMYAIDVYTDHHTCNLDEPELIAEAIEDFGTLTGTKITHSINGTQVAVAATRSVWLGSFKANLEYTADFDLSTSKSQFEISKEAACRLLAEGRR